MAATVQVHSFHGTTPGTGADVTSTEIRFKRADNDTVDALFPVPIPTSGTNYSWRKSSKIRIVTAPANQITNLRFFSSGTALGTGITHYAVVTATYTQGSSSDETALIAGGTDSTTYTSASPLVVNSGTVVLSTDSFPTYGTQDFVAQQVGVGTAASAGTSGARTYTLRYDES